MKFSHVNVSPQVPSATSFPQIIGIGATFNRCGNSCIACLLSKLYHCSSPNIPTESMTECDCVLPYQFPVPGDG